jgi:hypothetical protein
MDNSSLSDATKFSTEYLKFCASIGLFRSEEISPHQVADASRSKVSEWAEKMKEDDLFLDAVLDSTFAYTIENDVRASRKTEDIRRFDKRSVPVQEMLSVEVLKIVTNKLKVAEMKTQDPAPEDLKKFNKLLHGCSFSSLSTEERNLVYSRALALSFKALTKESTAQGMTEDAQTAFGLVLGVLRNAEDEKIINQAISLAQKMSLIVEAKAKHLDEIRYGHPAEGEFTPTDELLEKIDKTSQPFTLRYFAYSLEAAVVMAYPKADDERVLPTYQRWEKLIAHSMEKGDSTVIPNEISDTVKFLTKLHTKGVTADHPVVQSCLNKLPVFIERDEWIAEEITSIIENAAEPYIKSDDPRLAIVVEEGRYLKNRTLSERFGNRIPRSERLAKAGK